MNPPETPGVASPPPVKVKRLLDARGNIYEPAIGPRLKILLAVIFASVAILGATAVYLLAIRILTWVHNQDYATLLPSGCSPPTLRSVSLSPFPFSSSVLPTWPRLGTARTVWRYGSALFYLSRALSWSSAVWPSISFLSCRKFPRRPLPAR